MLKSCVKTCDLMERLRADKDGFASFEYILVALCVIGAVGGAFSQGAGGNVIQSALAAGIGSLTGAFATAIAG